MAANTAKEARRTLGHSNSKTRANPSGAHCKICTSTSGKYIINLTKVITFSTYGSFEYWPTCVDRDWPAGYRGLVAMQPAIDL